MKEQAMLDCKTAPTTPTSPVLHMLINTISEKLIKQSELSNSLSNQANELGGHLKEIEPKDESCIKQSEPNNIVEKLEHLLNQLQKNNDKLEDAQKNFSRTIG